MNIARVPLLSSGIVCLIISIGGTALSISHSDWLEATGTVVAVNKQCGMKSTERGILTKTTSEAVIDCEHVDAFKMLYSEQTWRMTPIYTGQLNVERDGVSTRAEMKLRATATREPQVGDVLALTQNPDVPSEVELAEFAYSYPLVALGSGVLAALLLYFGLRRKRPRASIEAASGRREAVDVAMAVAPVVARQSVIQPGRKAVFGRRGS